MRVSEVKDKNKGSNKCPSGFTEYSPISGHCFLIVAKYGATWENANQFCNLKQSSLIMPRTREQSDKIKDMIREEKRAIGFWIGLRKRRMYGKRRNSLQYNAWNWNDGKLLTVHSWQDWETSRPHKQDCVLLSRNRGFTRFVKRLIKPL